MLKKKQLTASYKLSDGASITSNPETARVYTNPVDFTVTAEDGTKKTYTVSVTFSPNRSTLSFQKDGKEFASGATFNSKDAVTVTVSAGGIPSGLESRIEAEVKSLHENTASNGATLDENPPVMTPKSLAAFPTAPQPSQTTKTLELKIGKNVRNNVISTLYLVEAKLFVRTSGKEWTEAKTERRQYASYFLDTTYDQSANDILEITYDKFIVAKGGEVILKIKKKDNDMSAYKHIEFQLQYDGGSAFRLLFFIKTLDKQKLLFNTTKPLESILQDRFATTDMVQDYKYENNTYQIKLKNLQKNIFWRLALVLGGGRPHTFLLPPILVTE